MSMEPRVTSSQYPQKGDELGDFDWVAGLGDDLEKSPPLFGANVFAVACAFEEAARELGYKNGADFRFQDPGGATAQVNKIEQRISSDTNSEDSVDPAEPIVA